MQKRDIKRVCRKLKLCEEHFEASQFMNPAEKGIYKPRKRLIHSAIPTLFNIPSPSPQLAIHRQYVASRNTKFSLMQMNGK